MEDIFLSIGQKIVEYVMNPILRHGRYLCCFNNFVGNLVIAKVKLELTQDRVKKQVTDATDRTEIIEPIVENWLKEVENVLQEVNMLEGKISEVSKSCFRKQCQYFLVKEIARKTEKMKELDLNSKFEPFSRIPKLPGMQYYSSKDFIFFESTTSAYNKILEKVKDKNVFKIGLYGIGGSGKTSLAKEVGKKFEELKLFEKVILATVSQNPNIRSIQAQMADQLGVQFSEESDEGRAQRLSQRLKINTTFLILDDVWKKLNFEAIGIPTPENKVCRVLLTTRNKEVCRLMDCEKIELDLLTSGDAWSLFKMHANITDDSPYALKGVARKIVDECKGLPIAIVTVGSTLKGQDCDEWELALSKLHESKLLDIPDGLKNSYICLKLSFDNLRTDLPKSLLLLCSIFPEDYEIHLEDLFRFGKGLGLIGTSGTMEIARKEMHVAYCPAKPSRALSIDGFNASAQSFKSLPIKDLFLRAEYLDLINLKGGYKNLIPCMDPEGQGMNHLIVLKLHTCLEMECLFDNANVGLLHTQVVFSNLVELVLHNMDSLREVFHDFFSQCFPKNREEIEEGNVRDQNHINLMFSKLRTLD
ncbi:hypothetical protein Fmac_017173 [Flemingia macrophylla]|uniref:NB-ARC domain-containing protein n=1 Tax=Flemingia macrophylla TaxID=520843 RepID=A0ABD1M1C9_9FABA